MATSILSTLGGVNREGSLDANAERLLAHGERLVQASALSVDDGALEDLDSLTSSLDDAEVHLHGVASLELGNIAKLLALDFVNDVAHEMKVLNRLHMLVRRCHVAQELCSDFAAWARACSADRE